MARKVYFHSAFQQQGNSESFTEYQKKLFKRRGSIKTTKKTLNDIKSGVLERCLLQRSIQEVCCCLHIVDEFHQLMSYCMFYKNR